MEEQGGLARGEVRDLEVVPANAFAPTRPDGLHAGLFGREAGGYAFKAVGFAQDVGAFFGREDAIEEAVAVAGYGGLDAVDFGEVDATTDDQRLGLHALGMSDALNDATSDVASSSYFRVAMSALRAASRPVKVRTPVGKRGLFTAAPAGAAHNASFRGGWRAKLRDKPLVIVILI